MQKSYYYNCNYCDKEYKPTKRGKQKFCTTSCRVAFFNANKKLKEIQAVDNALKLKDNETIKNGPKVNLPDITNAAIGHAASSILTNLFTPKSKKPVTKQDLENLKTSFRGGRYRPVLNCPPAANGQKAYFDLNTNEVIFSFNKLA